MTGAGFGGCAVALVERAGAAGVGERLAAEYRRRTDQAPEMHVCRAAEGASLS